MFCRALLTFLSTVALLMNGWPKDTQLQPIIKSGENIVCPNDEWTKINIGRVCFACDGNNETAAGFNEGNLTTTGFNEDLNFPQTTKAIEVCLVKDDKMEQDSKLQVCFPGDNSTVCPVKAMDREGDFLDLSDFPTLDQIYIYKNTDDNNKVYINLDNDIVCHIINNNIKVSDHIILGNSTQYERKMCKKKNKRGIIVDISYLLIAIVMGLIMSLAAYILYDRILTTGDKQKQKPRTNDLLMEQNTENTDGLKNEKVDVELKQSEVTPPIIAHEKEKELPSMSVLDVSKHEQPTEKKNIERDIEFNMDKYMPLSQQVVSESDKKFHGWKSCDKSIPSRKLVRWSDSSKPQAKMDLLVNENSASGWSVKDMFTANEKFNITTSYDPELTQYTTSIDRTSLTYRQREEQARRIAQSIRNDKRPRAGKRRNGTKSFG